MKSLESFPKNARTFAPETYGIDVRTNVGAESPYAGDVGLELELEGRNLPPSYRGRATNDVTWVAHADGSLRNGGMEYVLSQPCAKSDVKPLVDSLFADLKRQGATIANTTRCSTHVHINARGMKLNQLASFVVLWGTFEDVLSNWCGGHRSGNHFALRLSDCHSAVNSWIEAFRTGNFNFSRDRRYLALNPACLATFGSLEVRTMAGVEDSAEVVKWVEWLLAIRDAAKSEAFSDPTSIAAAFSGGSSREFAERIFGRAAAAELREATEALGENFDVLIFNGFRRVQEVCYALPWGAVVTEIKKPYVPDPFGLVVKPRTARPLRMRIPVPEPHFVDEEEEGLD